MFKDVAFRIEMDLPYFSEAPDPKDEERAKKLAHQFLYGGPMPEEFLICLRRGYTFLSINSSLHTVEMKVNEIAEKQKNIARVDRRQIEQQLEVAIQERMAKGGFFPDVVDSVLTHYLGRFFEKNEFTDPAKCLTSVKEAFWQRFGFDEPLPTTPAV